MGLGAGLAGRGGQPTWTPWVRGRSEEPKRTPQVGGSSEELLTGAKVGNERPRRIALFDRLVESVVVGR